MKKTLLTAALVASFGVAAVASQSAQAASGGTINFSGKVFADTCTVAVNSGATVTLPPVMVSAFSGAANTVAGATNFNIALTGCDTNITNAQMAFSGSQVDTSTGNLKNSLTSNNSNVEIQLLSGTNVVNTQTQANAPKISLAGTGAGSTTLTAQYISTSATTTAGLVASTVAFTLTYN
jgi:major type 1 subunit fimbrin (pilin)